jgi:hypothetical protein
MTPNDGYKLPEETKALLFNMVPTISFVLVGLAILCAPGEGSLYDRLRDFDGLIAAALAIFAAYITVRQMRLSDIKSDARHEDVLKLSVRGDSLRIERALNPQGAELENLLRDMQNYHEAVEAASNSQHRVGEVLLMNSGGHIRVAIGTLEVLNRPHFIDGAVLFDGELTDRIFKLTKNIEGTFDKLERAREIYRREDSNYEEEAEEAEWLENYALDIRYLLNFYIHQVPEIIRGMRSIGGRYGYEF